MDSESIMSPATSASEGISNAATAPSPSAPSDAGKNRRSHPRRESNAKVLCRMGKWGMGKPIAGKMMDISQSGAAIALASSVAEGQEVELEITPLIHAKSIRVPAKVIRAKPPENGQAKIIVEFGRRLAYDEIARCCR